MRRRELIVGLGAAAALAGPALAQRPKSIRRLGILTTLDERDPLGPPRHEAFLAALRKAGWSDGANLAIDWRFGAGDFSRMNALAAELIERRPDVVLTNGTPPTRALMKLAPSLPVVFVLVVDPVGDGIVASLARPGGNVTGFSNVIPGVETKWLEFIAEAVPGLATVGVMASPLNEKPYALRLGIVEEAAERIGVRVERLPVREASDIAPAMAQLAQRPKPGLIVLSDGFIVHHRNTIIGLAAKHLLPAIYPFGYFARGGGLVSYGVDTVDIYRRAADYIDRILRGAIPADLPVQQPTRFELVLNLRTAKALELDVPATLLVRADEVIE